MNIFKTFTIFNHTVHLHIVFATWKTNPTAKKIEKTRLNYYPETTEWIGRIKAVRLITGWDIPSARGYVDLLFKK